MLVETKKKTRACSILTTNQLCDLRIIVISIHHGPAISVFAGGSRVSETVAIYFCLKLVQERFAKNLSRSIFLVIRVRRDKECHV